MPVAVEKIDGGLSIVGRPSHVRPTSRSHSSAGQLAGLLNPRGERSFVALVVLLDVERPLNTPPGQNQACATDARCRKNGTAGRYP
jgi:hypothetical protein